MCPFAKNVIMGQSFQFEFTNDFELKVLWVYVCKEVNVRKSKSTKFTLKALFLSNVPIINHSCRIGW